MGLKSEGRIPIIEFARPGKNPDINIGDSVEVFVDRVDGVNGETKLSYEKALKQSAWNNLQDSFDNNKIVGEIQLEDVIFSAEWEFDSQYLVFVQSSFFEIYGSYGECVIENGNQVWKTLLLGLHPTKGAMYNEVAVWNDPQNAVVVYPLFTGMISGGTEQKW